MSMLREALSLWKTEKRHRGTTLQRRLILFFVCVTVFLVLLFTLLLLLFGINGKEETSVERYLAGELEHLAETVYDDFGRISLDGIRMAEIVSDSCDSFFAENSISGRTLYEHPDLLEPLLSQQMPCLLGTLDTRSCGGVFILLDATVQPDAENAQFSKAGIFLKKTQPTASQAVGVKKHFLRGPAQIARDNGIELLGQWAMEYDITEEDFFSEVMEIARQNETLPLSRLYYWSGRVTLKGNSEAGFLLCVPLRAKDGAVFGVCGIEVSDRMFKQLYCPSVSVYENVFAVAAPISEHMLRGSRGMIAGNYYLTGNRMTEDLTCSGEGSPFERFAGTDAAYSGKSAELRLYPTDSPHGGEAWRVAVIMPENLLADAVKGNSAYLPAIIFMLLIVSLMASILVSRRYLRPVTKALDSIRTNTYEIGNDARYVEIADLFDFLGEKDREAEQQRQELERRQREAQAQADFAYTELSRLTDKRRKEVDPDAYSHFLSQLGRLTPKEREVFNLYLYGKTAKEIIALMGFSENALKYHNKNIYEKVGVSSRKELLLYATLMRQEQEREKKE